jgi:hypothetical protein
MARLVPVAVAALALAGTVGPLRASAGEWSSPVLGGGGGDPFSARCEPGEYLIGLDARVGDDLDQVGAVCAKVKHDGTRKERSASRGGGGGGGGSPQRLVCPDDAPFVRSLAVDVEGVDGMMVNGASVECGPLAGPLPRRVAGYNLLSASGPIHRGGGGIGISDVDWDDATYVCPDAMAPVGVHGRAGAMVDALGLMCATIETPPPPSPVAEQKLRKGVERDAVTAPAPEPAAPPPPSAVQEKVRRGPLTAP